MDLDPIAYKFIIPGCVPINVINSINQLNLEWEIGEKHMGPFFNIKTYLNITKTIIFAFTDPLQVSIIFENLPAVIYEIK